MHTDQIVDASCDPLDRAGMCHERVIQVGESIKQYSVGENYFCAKEKFLWRY